MKKIMFIFITMLLLLRATPIYAAEVEPCDKIMYAFSETTAYLSDLSTVVTTFQSGTPIHVTGTLYVEDKFGYDGTYWYRVDIGGEFYIPARMLVQVYPFQKTTVSYDLPLVGGYETATFSNVAEMEAIIRRILECRSTGYDISPDGNGKYIFQDLFRTIRSYGLGTYNENTASAPETRKNHYDIVYRYSLQDELLLTNAVREVVQTLNNGSAYEKVKAAHDYICNNVTYCYEKTENGNDMYINAYDAMFHHQTF